MRALPLWQPWASLVVNGSKMVETRPNPAPSTIVGERVAIHACLTRDHLGLVELEPFASHVPHDVPLGHLIGTVLVTGSFEMTEVYVDSIEQINPLEFAFGHYAPGRHAWALQDPTPLECPVRWKGKQGIVMVPDDLEQRPFTHALFQELDHRIARGRDANGYFGLGRTHFARWAKGDPESFERAAKAGLFDLAEDAR